MHPPTNRYRRNPRNIASGDHTLTTTHIAVVVLFGLILDLNRTEWLVALMFGVVIDIDHVFAAPRYISDNGWSAILRPTWADGSGEPYKSLFHEPIGFFVMAPLSVGWRYLLPLFAWGSHVSLDWLQNSTLAFSTPIESAILLGACSGIVAVAYWRWAEVREDASFKEYLSYMRDVVKDYLGPGSDVKQGQ